MIERRTRWAHRARGAAQRPQGKGDTMNRNGKAPQGAGDTLALMGAPSEVVGTPPKTLGMASEAVGTPPKTLGMASEAVGMASEAVGTAPKVLGMTDELRATADEPRATPSRRRVAAFGTNASIAQRLAAAQVAIEAVLTDRDLQLALAAYGYDAARMQEGKALRERAQSLQQQQRARYGAAYGATDVRATAQQQAHATYMRHLGVARIALRGDRAAAQTLGLAATRKTTQAGWLLQAQQFYTNALADARSCARWRATT
jgi:hypothetical protein